MTSGSYLEDLKAIEEMRRYYTWKAELLSVYAGPRLLEVGCGTGLMLEQFPKRELLLGIDRDPNCIRLAQERLAGHQNVRLSCMDILEERFLEFSEMRLATVIFANSLEEITDVSLALKHTFAILVPGGQVAIFAPAFPILSGKLDKAFIEQRRFRIPQIAELLKAASFEISELRYVNLLGIPAWIWDSVIRGKTAITPGGYRIRDRLVPVAQFIDKLTGPPIGLSLLAAGRKP